MNVNDDDTPRFSLSNISGALEYLEEHGYVVFCGVLTEEEIETAKSLFWDFVEGIPERLKIDSDNLTPEKLVKRSNVLTWGNEFWPGNWSTGIFSGYGAGQSPFSWFIRTRPIVKQIFSQLWKTDNLLVSFDGFNAFRPWIRNPEWKTKGGWFHVDQNAKHKPNKECIQGLVTLYDVDHFTGGLTVIPGSHKSFKEISNTLNIRHDFDFLTIPEEHPAIESQKPKLVRCLAGDLCLWDSRTIHCNSPGIEGMEAMIDGQITRVSGGAQHGESELLRLVSYVCMTPKSKVKSHKILQQRKEALKHTQSTTHWPHEFCPSSSASAPFPNNPYVDHSLVTGNQTCSIM